MVIWFIGMSGSGKTTLSNLFIEKINKLTKKHIIHLDGDNIRFLFDNKDYSISGRKKNAKVISFEPIEETSSNFLENIRINESDNITLVSKALSDKVETVTFRIPDSKSNHSVASMMWHKSNKNTIAFKLQTYVLDDMHEYKDLSPSVIKIDVEGAEGKVVLGMKNLISRCRPIIYIECSKAGRQTTWDMFKELKYSCFFCFNLDKEVVNFSEYRHNDFVWIPN